MARRRRLTPPNPEFLPSDAPVPRAPETKSLGPDMAPPPVARVAGEASASAALEELAGEFARARDEGRMVLPLPLDKVRLDYLVRDRLLADPDELEVLKISIRMRGQQTPIEVTDLGDGTYGLISGWRRCQALLALQKETQTGRFDTVLALVRKPAESADAYLAMVEENEIRVDLSHFERARIVAKAVEQGVFDSHKKALLTLFRSASRAKRSKIRSFLPIVESLEGALRFPEAMSERTGLALSKALEQDPDLARKIRQALELDEPLNPAQEQKIIERVLDGEKQSLNRRSETDSDSVSEIAPGLRAKLGKNGALTLSGPAMTEELRTRLLAWLADQT